MENVTHTLVGLMMARAGLEKTTVRGTAMMLLAANVPDVDAFYFFTDRLRYLDHHRSYTHSLAFVPLMALLPMLLVWAKVSWRSYAASMAGVLSHVLLDWTNPYGIQLLLPFSHRRVMLDITNIADIWIWVILFIGLLAPILPGLMSSVASANAHVMSPGARERWAWFALVALFSYECARFAAHDRAVEILSSQRYRSPSGQTVPPREVIAVPADFVHPLRWRGIVRADGFVALLPVNIGGDFNPRAVRVFQEAPPGSAIEAAKLRPDFQVMMRFSRAPFWMVTPVPDGSEVSLVDLRYSSPEGGGFAAVSAVVPAAAR